MKIQTLQHGTYKNCKVYYRRFGTTFEYLAVIDGEIYTAHITIVKKWWQMLLGLDFTPKQLVDCTNYLARIAETTIDYVLAEKAAA